MIIRYCPISLYGYPLLPDITQWLSGFVCCHPMVIRYCPISPYGYPLLPDITL